MRWVEKTFADLTVPELYEILALRQRIFIVEQTCPYNDIDHLDSHAFHLWTLDDAGALSAYLRILPPAIPFAEPSVGRVIVSPSSRGTGLGLALMREGMARCWAHHGPRAIRIGAQLYLERFYTSLGFRRASDEYLEDGIPHVEMLADPPDASREVASS
jgi:ElaA protein